MKNMEAVIKIQVGDVVSIPMDNGNFGIAQILKREHSTLNGNAFMILFDKEFTAYELKNIDYCSLKDIPVLSGMPLSLFKIKKKHWAIIGNTDPVYYPIPMFKFWSPDYAGQSIEESTYLIDFGHNYCRFATLDELSRVRTYFTSSANYFEMLLNIRFVDPTILDRLPKNWTYTWPDNVITEQEDMPKNTHLYRKWLGFGSES